MARALVADEIQLVIGSMPAFVTLIQSGRVRALAAAASERLPALPNVPSLRENGIDFERTLWNGFFAPAGIPRAVLSKLSNAMVEIAKGADVEARIRSQGTDPRTVGF